MKLEVCDLCKEQGASGEFIKISQNTYLCEVCHTGEMATLNEDVTARLRNKEVYELQDSCLIAARTFENNLNPEMVLSIPKLKKLCKEKGTTLDSFLEYAKERKSNEK